MTPSLPGIFLRLNCFFIFAVTTLVAQENSSWTVPHFSADAAAVFQVASSATAKKGSAVLVLQDENTITFDTDGKSVSSSYKIFKILSEGGANGWDSLTVVWEPWHQEKPTVKARVITSDNVSHPLDQNTITDSPAGDSSAKEYGDRRVVRVPLPAISPGAVVEEEFTVRETAPLFAAGTVDRRYFGATSPVRDTQLLLDAPASLNLQYNVQLLPQVKVEKKEEGGRVHVRFSQGTLDAIETGERYLPSELPVYPQVTFSVGSTWQRMAESYGKLVDEAIQRGGVSELATELAKGKATPDEKLAAFIQYLSKDVRYTGVEFGASGLVPHAPAETLKQKYGDCKDKSTLLVALARATGIPAYVALLKIGAREDVPSNLPGMGLFDHAIVYIPGKPEHWIDTTDEHARLGQLPSADEGRLSLIARAESTALVRTPEANSKANRLHERREFYLAENGPARVVEISEPEGVFESSYRSYYADADNKDNRKNLTDYVKREYLAEKLTKFERTEPRDLSRPFRMTLEATPAKRGITELDDAVAAIRLESLFVQLPGELQRKEQAEKTKQGEADETAAKPRIGDYELGEAFLVDWEYTIVPPAGFRPKALPEKRTMALGPGVFTRELSADANGTVHGRITFDTVKRRLTLAEAKEMGNKVAQLKEEEPILILFEPISQALLAQGKVRESFQAIRDLIALHPKEAVHHLQMAKALLSGGMAEESRRECRKAVELEPTSALAQKTLAETLEYDLVGRKLRKGSDYAGAAAAYRAAQKLDPEDQHITANLAILLEYNDIGERYGRGAKLKEAVAEYHKLKDEQLKDMGVQNNSAFSLFYSGEIAEARKEGEALNPPLKALIVAAEAITNGSQAGIAEARRRNSGEAELKSTLKTAGEMAMRYRAYAIAADLLEAGASGDNSSNTMALAGMMRNAKKREEIVYKDYAAGLVQKMFVDILDGKLTPEAAEAISSRNALIVEKRTDPEEVKRSLNAASQITGMFLRQGLPVDAMTDIVVQVMQTNVEGDDTNGFLVSLSVPGDTKLQEIVVKENGHFRLLDSMEKPNSVALEILERVQANNLAGARILLDWVRDAQHLQGGDDPLAGFAFPRMWTKGKEGDARQMKMAAAAMACETKETAPEGIAILESSSKEAMGEVEKLNFSLALLDGYSALKQYGKQLTLAAELAKDHAESKRLFLDRNNALRGLGKFEEADALAEAWLKKEPGDLQALRAEMLSAVAAEKFALARERSKNIVDKNKGEAGDYNNQAWYSLFTGKTDASDVEAATKAAQLSKMSPGVLHTLGCVYAELGKASEAREVLIQGMDGLYLNEPDDNYWYAFGRIAEQFGELQAAQTDYKAVKRPKDSERVAGSSYQLAQMRLQAIAKQTNSPATK